MGDHFIDVVPIGKRTIKKAGEGGMEEVDVIQSDPNPFPGEGESRIALQPGDTVTWKLPPNQKMRVEFLEVQDLPTDSNSTKPLDDPLGPFKSLTAEDGRIVGTLRDDIPATSDGFKMRRFYYVLLQEGKNIEWKEKPPGAPSTRLGGGVDVPTKPPRGGVGG